MNEWSVLERNVSICPMCNGGMALWQNTVTKEYLVSCDHCQHEYTPNPAPIDFSNVQNSVQSGLPSCSTCKFFDDIETHYKNHGLDIIYCSACPETFERRQKPFKCKFSPLCKGADNGAK